MRSLLAAFVTLPVLAAGQQIECGWSEIANVSPIPIQAPHGPLTIRLPDQPRSWRVGIEPAVKGTIAAVFKAMPRDNYCDVQVMTVPYQLTDGGRELLLGEDTLDLTALSGPVQRIGLMLALPESLRVNIHRGNRQIATHIVNGKFALLGDTLPEPRELTAMDYFVNELVWPPRQTVRQMQSPRLRALVVPEHGGELGSLAVRYKGRWIELLYRAMDYAARPGWTGKAPFLWPATGRNFPKDVAPNEEARGSSYDWHGKRLPMPIHGFARDLPWKVENATPTRVRLSLSDSDRTREYYPFGFHAMVDYTVKANTIVLDYTITAAAANSEPMPFSAGNHITFRTPLVPGADPLVMTFESPSTLEFLKAAGGIPTGEKRDRTFSTATPLGQIPANAAISLGGYKEEPSMILRDPAGITIRMKQIAATVPDNPVVRFNVWGDPRNGYFSPEPWVGLQNSFNLNQGMVRLEPGQSWKWRIEITVEAE